MSLAELMSILGNAGEFLGSIAVLVTLVYLAVQVKHSRELLERQQRLSRSQVHQTRISDRIEMEMHVAESEELASIILKAASGTADLSPVERLRLRGYASANLAVQENNLYQAELGLVDDATLRSTIEIVCSMTPEWRELGLTIPPRIQTCFEEHGSQSKRAGR